jgi:hydrogenase maturation protease
LSVATTVIVGVGNLLLGDDGVGVVVARRLAKRLEGREDVAVIECPVGGLRLAELLAGHDHAVVVDAWSPGEDPPGTIRDGGLEACRFSTHTSCSHDTNLPLAVLTLTGLGVPMPKEIRLIGIAAERVDTFGEQLTPAVAAAAEQVVDRLAAHVEQA